MPQVKCGNILSADYVLTHLNIRTNKNWGGSYANGNPIWGKAEDRNGSVSLVKQPVYSKWVMPDVTGMGARDAVYMLETRGLKVTIYGRGKVYEQSIHPGVKIRRGQRCSIKLNN